MRNSKRTKIKHQVIEDSKAFEQRLDIDYNRVPKKNIDLFPKQMEVIKDILDNSENCKRYILVGWWANWWKTYWIVHWIIFSCMKYKWIKWCAWRSTVQQTDRSLRLTINKALTQWWYKLWNKWSWWKTVINWHYYFDASKNYYHFVNGSEIRLLSFGRIPSDPDYEFLSWQEYTYCYIDEVQDWVEKQAVDIITTRLRHMTTEYKIVPKVIMSCNPKKCWIKDEFYDPWMNWIEKKDNKFIQMLYTDNYSIDQQAYAEQILSTWNKIAIERKLKWNWEYEDIQWKLYEYDDLVRMFSQSEPENDLSIMWLIDAHLDDKYLLTIDPSGNWKDRAVCFVWKWWDIVDSIIMTGAVDWVKFKNKILEMKEKYWIRNKYIVNDCNGIWWHLWSELNATEKHLNDWLNTILAYYAQWTELSEWFKSERKKYWMLRDQCFRLLKNYIKRIRIKDEKLFKYKDQIIDELDVVTQVDMDNDAELIKILPKKAIKAVIDASSPDLWDNFSFRVYAELRHASRRNIDINKISQKINERVFKWYRSF